MTCQLIMAEQIKVFHFQYVKFSDVCELVFNMILFHPYFQDPHECGDLQAFFVNEVVGLKSHSVVYLFLGTPFIYNVLEALKSMEIKAIGGYTG